MPVIDVYNINKEKIKEIELPDEVFNVQVKEPVLHQVVTMQLAQRRSGNACTNLGSPPLWKIQLPRAALPMSRG